MRKVEKTKYIKKLRQMTDKELQEEKRRVVEEIATLLFTDERIRMINSEILRREREKTRIMYNLFNKHKEDDLDEGMESSEESS